MSTKRLELLCKWRQVYCLQATSGQIGFERYVRDAAEAKLLHRAELSAIVALLVQKKVFTNVEFAAQVEVESEFLNEAMQKTFPGFTAKDNGIALTNPMVTQTMKNWQQPYGLG